MMKDLLLTHAEQLARHRGFDAFSYADLANGAGIKKASVHYHFPTKADLSLAMIDAYADRVIAMLSEADGETAGARLAHIVALYRGALEDGRSLCLCVSFSASHASLPQPTRDRVAQFQRDVQRWLKTLFADARGDQTISMVYDPQAESAACFATLEGAQLAARATQDIATYDQATALLRSRIRPGAPI